MDVPPEELGTDLAQFGLEDVTLLVDFLLAPIMTSCTSDGTFVLQIGDMRVDAAMTMYGMPVEMTAFSSMEIATELVPVQADDGTQQLAISLGDIRIMEVEITEIKGQLAGAEDVIVSLVKDNLVVGFLDSFAGEALGSFPIPDVDLSGVNEAVPPGSKIGIDLEKVLRILGYTVLSGNVQQ